MDQSINCSKLMFIKLLLVRVHQVFIWKGFLTRGTFLLIRTLFQTEEIQMHLIIRGIYEFHHLH